MSTLFAPVAVATGALLAVAACSASEAGMPRAAETGGPVPGSSSGSAAPISPLSGVDPCALLSDSDRSRLGVKNGESDNTGNVKSCDWIKSGDWGVGVAVHPKTGFKGANLQGGSAVFVSLGKHQAHKVENLGGGNGTCEIFLEVSASSMVQISGTDAARGDTPKACGKATQVAQIIDPKLP